VEHLDKIARALDFAGTAGWSTVWGIFDATSFTENADMVKVHFEGIAGGNSLIIDDISISPLPRDCSELIVDSDVEMGMAQFWERYGTQAGDLSTTAGVDGGLAARVTNRNSAWKGMEYEGVQWTDLTCFGTGQLWEITAQIKLMEQGGDAGVGCDVSSNQEVDRCPRLRLRLYDESDLSTHFYEEVKYNYVPSAWNTNGFNEFKGHFHVPIDGWTTMGKIRIIVSDVRKGVDIVVNNLSMKPMH
jgi:hypothetical protein